MDTALRPIRDKQQLKQAGKLQQLEIQGQKMMGDYNFKKQMELWDKTNYDAQVKQMQKAGLNIGLMYGGSGQGGTTQSLGAGNVAGQQASEGDMMQQKVNPMAMAQIENIKADTEQKKAETAKTSDVDTEEALSRIEKMKQETSNARVQGEIMGYEKSLKQIELSIGQRTVESVVDEIQASASKLVAEARSANAKGDLDEASLNELITQVQQDTIEQKLRMAMIKAGTAKTEMDTEKSRKEIKLVTNKIWEIVQNVGQGWEKLKQTERKVIIDEAIMELNKTVTGFNTSTAARIGQWTGIIGNLLSGVTKLGGINK